VGGNSNQLCGLAESVEEGDITIRAGETLLKGLTQTPETLEVYWRIAARVRVMRRTLGLSPRELARRSAMSAATVARVERMETTLRIDTVSALAHGLGVSLRRLLKQRTESVH
jgi:ribosome-binding protein aMBF1 (putative translation factor)